MEYTISQFDGGTWQVIEDGHELCTVGDYEGHEDSEDRAARIRAAMELANIPIIQHLYPNYSRRPFNPQPKPEGKKKRNE